MSNTAHCSSPGATLGAGSIIGCNLTIGRFAMVGMGSLVTKSVPAFALMLGHPARCLDMFAAAGSRSSLP